VLELISEMIDDILRGICDGFDLIFGYWPDPEEKPDA